MKSALQAYESAASAAHEIPPPLAGRYDAQPGLRMYCHTLGVDLSGGMAYDKSHERRRNQAHTRGRGNHSHT